MNFSTQYRGRCLRPNRGLAHRRSSVVGQESKTCGALLRGNQKAFTGRDTRREGQLRKNLEYGVNVSTACA